MITRNEFQKYIHLKDTKLETQSKNAIINYTVGIIATKQERSQPGEIGSGTLIKYEGINYILTADHVVKINNTEEYYQENEIFIAHRKGPYIEDFTRQISYVKHDDELDLCLLEVLNNEAIRETKQYYGISEDIDLDYNDCNDVIALAGSPAELVDVKDEPFRSGIARHIEIQPILFPSWTCSVDVKYIYVAYNTDLPPGGFSGGGLWSTGFQFNDAWKEDDVKLLGVTLSHCEKYEYVKCINKKFIKIFLES